MTVKTFQIYYIKQKENEWISLYTFGLWKCGFNFGLNKI